MYNIIRENGRITISDWTDKVIYSALESSYLISKRGGTGPIDVVKIGQLTDDQLLTILASHIKLQF